MLTPLLCPAHMAFVRFTPYLGKGMEECFPKTFFKVRGQLVNQGLSRSCEGSWSPGWAGSLQREGGFLGLDHCLSECRGKGAVLCDTRMFRSPGNHTAVLPRGGVGRAQHRGHLSFRKKGHLPLWFFKGCPSL